MASERMREIVEKAKNRRSKLLDEYYSYNGQITLEEFGQKYELTAQRIRIILNKARDDRGE